MNIIIRYLEKNWCTISSFIISIVIPALAVAFIAKKLFDLIGGEFVIIFLVGIIVSSSICYVICYLIRNYLVVENVSPDSLELDKIRDCLSKNTFRIILTFLVTIFIALAALYIYTPLKIVIEPKNFEEDIFLGNQSAKTISIKNIGGDLSSVTLDIEGIKRGWISINPESFQSLKSGEIEFALVNITLQQNEIAGEYRGAIIIHGNTDARKVTEVIPVVLHVKPLVS